MEPTNYPFQPTFSEEDNLDIKRYLSMFISNWYWFAGALFISMSIAYGINRYSEKIYTVSSTLLIKDDQFDRGNSNLGSVIPGGDIFKSQQNLKNEIGILKSFSLNDSVMKKMDDFHVIYAGVGKRGIVESRLYKSSPFKVIYDSLKLEPKGRKVEIEILSDKEYNITLDGEKNSKVKMLFGKNFIKQGFDFTIVPRIPGADIFSNYSSNSYYFYFTDPESLAAEYSGKLSVAPIEKEASLVTLSVSGFVLEQEADYLNKLMQVYIDYGLENKNRTATSTIKFIDKQLAQISDSLTRAEENLEKFRLANKFLNLSLEGTRIQSKLERLENEKASFDLQFQYYKYLAEYIDNKKADEEIISPSVMGITDAVLLRLVNELSTIQKEREKLGLNFEANQPALNLIDKQTEETKEALKENIKNGMAGLSLLISESESKIALVNTEINKLPTTERKLINIQRQYDLNNTVYTYLLEKRAESGIARASNVSDNRIIDYASIFSSGLIKPKTRYNNIIALILGFALPIVSLVLIDYFNDKVIDKRDVERRTKVPVIGYISHIEGKSEIPVVEKPGSSFAESFRSVRTSIKYFIKENEKPVIAVSSTISSEGKTFVSINLAAIIAMLGKKVLLIGLDLRKPRIDKAFKFDSSPGMSAYLSGNCTYEEVIKPTQISNLFYAPAGTVPPNPAELIETEEMKKFIDRAKEEFDYIIIDTPPVAIVTDTLLLAPYVDLNLFIVRQRYSSRNTLDLIEQLNRDGKLKHLAIIINDINISGYYGYGMRYGYALGYGYSYGYNYYGKGYYGRYGYTEKRTEYYTEG
jgi:capsular exopolysaccharide synthesis family protein